MPVYPRVCGGIGNQRFQSMAQTGLSPRVRGNHPKLLLERHCHWSIPACAGESRHKQPNISGRKVYPRVCGGIVNVLILRKRQIGLSLINDFEICRSRCLTKKCNRNLGPFI